MSLWPLPSPSELHQPSPRVSEEYAILCDDSKIEGWTRKPYRDFIPVETFFSSHALKKNNYDVVIYALTLNNNSTKSTKLTIAFKNQVSQVILKGFH